MLLPVVHRVRFCQKTRPETSRPLLFLVTGHHSWPSDTSSSGAIWVIRCNGDPWEKQSSQKKTRWSGIGKRDHAATSIVVIKMGYSSSTAKPLCKWTVVVLQEKPNMLTTAGSLYFRWWDVLLPGREKNLAPIWQSKDIDGRCMATDGKPSGGWHGLSWWGSIGYSPWC